MFALILSALGKYREMRRNRKLTRAELEAIKLKKFRRFVNFANKKSPYYADIIKQRNIDLDNCVPQDFPLLTKSILMQNFDRIITNPKITKQSVTNFLSQSKDPTDLMFNKYHVIHTSGSSGEVGYFIFSDADWGRGMSPGARRQDRPDIKRPKGKMKFAYFAAVDGHYAGVSMACSMRRGILKWFFDIALYDVNDPLPKVINELNEYQPHFIFGYTTAMKILVEKQNAGSLHISPLAVGTGGEAMTDSDKEMLSKAFGCEAFGSYGCSEHLGMGMPNPDNQTMVLYDNDLIYEFYEDHTVVTNMFNYTLPLIRYRMSDVIQPLYDDKSAEPYLTIKTLLGRSEIVPAFTNEDGDDDFINAITIVELFVAGITRFQMELHSKTRFLFKVCLDPSLSTEAGERAVAEMRQRLSDILQKKLMSNVQFDVLAVDDLPVNPKTRKFQLIVDKTNAGN